MNQQWLSIYIYYTEPWEQLLVKSVKPLADTAIQTGIANRFFFIRYYERGPHIRLRFAGEPHHIQTFLQENIIDHFNYYLESKPSMRQEPQYALDANPDEKWLPNNSLQLVDYEPELKRYCGKVGMALAEEHFMISSNTILTYLADADGQYDYEDAMGTAIALYLGFAYSVGWTREEAAAFFDAFSYAWMPTAQLHTPETPLADMERVYDQSFQEQQDLIMPFAFDLWESLEQSPKVHDNAMLNYWISENHRLHWQWIEAQQQLLLLKRSADYQYRFRKPLAADTEQLWSIYFDLLHLTNNRLGIHNRDEAFIAYIMKRFFQSGVPVAR